MSLASSYSKPPVTWLGVPSQKPALGMSVVTTVRTPGVRGANVPAAGDDVRLLQAETSSIDSRTDAAKTATRGRIMAWM